MNLYKIKTDNDEIFHVVAPTISDAQYICEQYVNYKITIVNIELLVNDIIVDV